MPKEPLPPDSLDRWKQMPNNRPSKEALPPASGGTRLALGLLIVMGVLLILGLLLQNPPS